MTAGLMVGLAMVRGRCECDGICVYSDGNTADEEPLFAVYQRTGDRSEGLHGLTRGRALALIAHLRCSTATTDTIVQLYLKGIANEPDVTAARGDL